MHRRLSPVAAPAGWFGGIGRQARNRVVELLGPGPSTIRSHPLRIVEQVVGTASTEELLQGLTAPQRAAVVSEAQPLCIVAAAGAGKTRVLTRRIAYRCVTGRADAGHTLALTFTRKAAAELQHRLDAMGLRRGVAAGTFHSHATAQLQRWWADRRQSPPTLLERKSRVLGPIVDARAAVSAAPLSEVAGLIEWAKARTIGPDEFETAVTATGRPLPGGLSPAALAGVYARYEHEKRRRGLVDFDDLLSRCAEAIERDPEFAGAQRWRWRHVYVDEFQDLNPLQHRLLLAWLGTSRDLCVVGDPNQAIYGWNGSDPQLLGSFASRWPGAEVLRLDANHRCTDQIVRVAAAVLGPEGAGLSGVDRHGPAAEVHGFASEQVEARAAVAALVAAHKTGRPWSAMAVLTRTNAQISAFQEALTAAGIPWWSAASAALLDHPAVRGVLAPLRFGAVPVRTRPLRAAVADLREIIAETASGGVGSAGSAVSAGSAGSAATRSGATTSGEAVAALEALVETGAALLSSRPEASVSDWLDWLPTTAKDRSDRTSAVDTVTLSSFHRAKGLEWDLVWVAGVEEGLVPLGRARGAALEEERRLLYVALTRAVDELHVSWAATRAFGNRPVPRQPSRWLEAVADAASEVASGEAVRWAGAAGSEQGEAAWRGRLADQRDALHRSAAQAGRPLGRLTPEHWPDADDRLRQALLSWRLEAARASGVPPKVLLHDVTVEALASLRPRTTEELLGIPGLGPVKVGRYGPLLLDLMGERAESA